MTPLVTARGLGCDDPRVPSLQHSENALGSVATGRGSRWNGSEQDVHDEHPASVPPLRSSWWRSTRPGMILMRAWRVHDVGEPEDVFVLEDDEPTAARLAEMGMSMGGWVPLDEAPYKVTPEFAILDMRAAALALPDVTMARGTYPVPVPHPYISGQEGVGIVRETSPGLTHLIGTRVVGVCIQPWGSLGDVGEAPPRLNAHTDDAGPDEVRQPWGRLPHDADALLPGDVRMGNGNRVCAARHRHVGK